MPTNKGRGKRCVGSSKCKKTHKQQLRGIFAARHIDQVWEDVRKEVVHDGKQGPLGTTSKAALDEDLPAHGKFYCVPCSRYFISAAAQTEHARTKPHKRRIKALKGAKPHDQKDADWAAGMGVADNGEKLRAPALPVAMDI
ncbi:hypothetical protein WJX72_011735 [[Myrmecia] bisecta]|uniref:C2H2-type domain-containing protein n=1 Tax=[Myrmecia] bisecta TaxID=41462 RepID=A0AAW1R8V3_9CHLO